MNGNMRVNGGMTAKEAAKVDMHCFYCGSITTVDYIDDDLIVRICKSCNKATIERMDEKYGTWHTENKYPPMFDGGARE